jgi:archaemetzincin
MYDNYITSKYNWYDTKSKNTIYIQPLEDEISKDFIKILEEFCQAFYTGVIVKILPTIDVAKLKITSRTNEYSNNKQYLASEILSKLQHKLPKDAYCLIGVMLTDIYPREEWNFGIHFFKLD